MSDTKIIQVPYGLSSNYGDFIEINYKLLNPLREKILKHEMRHSQGNYCKEDFKNDFNSKKPYFFDSLMFAFKNPEALINFFPLMYSYYAKKLSYNLTSIFPFFYYGILFSVLCTVIFKVNIFNVFIAYTLFIIFCNIFLLILTNIIVKKSCFQYKEVDS